MLAAVLKKVAVHFLGSIQAASLHVVSGMFVWPFFDERDLQPARVALRRRRVGDFGLELDRFEGLGKQLTG